MKQPSYLIIDKNINLYCSFLIKYINLWFVVYIHTFKFESLLGY
jgi:hypothetical protein